MIYEKSKLIGVLSFLVATMCNASDTSDWRKVNATTYTTRSSDIKMEPIENSDLQSRDDFEYNTVVTLNNKGEGILQFAVIHTSYNVNKIEPSKRTFSVADMRERLTMMQTSQKRVSTCNYDEFDAVEGSTRKYRAGYWFINNTKIQMVEWCDIDKSSNTYWYGAGPLSEAGTNYIINQLKKSKSSVHVEADSYSFDINAIGFTRIWRKLNSDAL